MTVRTRAPVGARATRFVSGVVGVLTLVVGLVIAPATSASAAEGARWAHLFLHDGSALLGVPVAPPQQNSVSGAVSTVTRIGTGEFTVRFVDVGVTGTELGVVHVTSAVANTECQVRGSPVLVPSESVPGHFDALVGVGCRTVGGSPFNARFYAFWTRAEGTPRGGPGAYAYALADEPTTDTYTPKNSFASTDVDPVVQRRGTGAWTVRLSGDRFRAGGGSVQVTPFGTGPGAASRCHASNWAAGPPPTLLVDVECYSPANGAPTDTAFMFTYQRERSLLGEGGVIPYGYVRNDQPQPSPYSYPAGASVTSSGLTGLYTVTIPLPDVDPGPFTVQVAVLRPTMNVCSLHGIWRWERGSTYGRVICRSAGGSGARTAFSLSFLGT